MAKSLDKSKAPEITDHRLDGRSIDAAWRYRAGYSRVATAKSTRFTAQTIRSGSSLGIV